MPPPDWGGRRRESLALMTGIEVVAHSVDELRLSGTFRGSARVPLDGVIVRPREPPTLVGRMGLALAHRSEFG